MIRGFGASEQQLREPALGDGVTAVGRPLQPAQRLGVTVRGGGGDGHDAGLRIGRFDGARGDERPQPAIGALIAGRSANPGNPVIMGIEYRMITAIAPGQLGLLFAAHRPDHRRT